jgi:hypothetical protein
MYEIDTDVDVMCKKVDAVYTRYSDDISLSSKEPDVLGPLEQKVRARIESNRSPILKLNDAKRVAVGRGSAMTVTGLTLSNQGLVTVGRKRKRGVRSGVRQYVRGLLTDDGIAVLKGEIAFVLSIEPGYKLALLQSYGSGISPLLPRPRITA